jgi:hypothetical protein
MRISKSFRRFAVIGQSKPAPDQEHLDRLAEHALRPNEFGVPEEVEYGWNGGEHLLDRTFSFEHNVFADCLLFGLQIDSNAAPGAIKKAYLAEEEKALAATNPSGLISKAQKQAAKELTRQRLDEDMKAGKFLRRRLVPVLWDMGNSTVYSHASGAALEKLLEIFERSFALELQPLTAGVTTLRILEPAGRRRDYEDLHPTRFALGPEGEAQQPDYPWVAKGPEPKDFLGNEFLLWLWHTSSQQAGAVGDTTILIDKRIDLDCAYGQTGKDTVRGMPTQMPEAMAALRVGKLPRKAGLIVDAKGQQFSLTLAAETLAVSGLTLPEVEDADTPRTLLEEQIELLRTFGGIMDGLFREFVLQRAGAEWGSTVGTIRQWIERAPQLRAVG